MLGDPLSEFTKSIGMEFDAPAVGFWLAQSGMLCLQKMEWLKFFCLKRVGLHAILAVEKPY